MPLSLLGCRLLEVFPQVPLLQSTGMGVALFSYDGKLCWGAIGFGAVKLGNEHPGFINCRTQKNVAAVWALFFQLVELGFGLLQLPLQRNGAVAECVDGV